VESKGNENRKLNNKSDFILLILSQSPSTGLFSLTPIQGNVTDIQTGSAFLFFFFAIILTVE
jgi:hypothetical protein